MTASLFHTSTRRLSRTSLSRTAAAALLALWGFLAIYHPVTETTTHTYLVLFVLIFLARILPIASTRERRITFTASVVFMGTLLAGPWAAGFLCIAAYVLDALLFRRPHFWHGLLRETVYLLGTAPVAAVFFVFQTPLPLGNLTLAKMPAFICAAVFFVACFTAPFYWGARLPGKGTSDRRGGSYLGRVWAAASGEAVAFALGLPFAVLLVVLSPGDFAVAGLAFALYMGASVWAVRAGVELRALRKQVRAMEILGGQAIDTQNLDSLLAHLRQAAHDLIQFDCAFFWIVDENEERLHLRTVWPRDTEMSAPPLVAMGEGLVGRVAGRRRGVIITDGDDTRWAGDSAPRRPDGGMASVLVTPLVTTQRVVGVALFAHQEPDKYGSRDLQLLQSVANLVASAIENVRLHQSIHAMAVTDGLTGLTNHRRLQEILTEETWRSQRYERPISIIMCDVDFFKAYNDTYGHPQGDVLLQRVAQALRGSVRAVDTVARYGGEEFCIILPETEQRQAEKMAERLRRAIEETPFPGKPGEMVRKTMSFGVASFPESTHHAEQLVSLADEALYRAKRGGKNQVQSARRAPGVPVSFRTSRLPRR